MRFYKCLSACLITIVILMFNALHQVPKTTSKTEFVEVEKRVEVPVLVPTKIETSRGTPRNQMVVEATAYSYLPGDNITASGLPVDKGVIAVDPNIIPLGSIVWIDGYGYALAADTGSAIKGNKIDLFFKSESDAVHWGVKDVRIKIIQ